MCVGGGVGGWVCLTTNTFQSSSPFLFSPSQISDISGIPVERVDFAKVSLYTYRQTVLHVVLGVCVSGLL